jgi:hypothetical protein
MQSWTGEAWKMTNQVPWELMTQFLPLLLFPNPSSE